MILTSLNNYAPEELFCDFYETYKVHPLKSGLSVFELAVMVKHLPSEARIFEKLRQDKEQADKGKVFSTCEDFEKSRQKMIQEMEVQHGN